MSFRVGDKVRIVKNFSEWEMSADQKVKSSDVWTVIGDTDHHDYTHYEEKEIEIKGVNNNRDDFELVLSAPINGPINTTEPGKEITAVEGAITIQGSAITTITNAIHATPLVTELTARIAAPIKSDGGSSSYYDIPLPAEFMKVLIERYEAGNPHIRTEELIRYAFSNDFDYGTGFKSMVRSHAITHLNSGKAGNDVNYECNKIDWSVNKVRQFHGKKK